MKRARFTEEQIIGILRENEAGAKSGRGFAHKKCNLRNKPVLSHPGHPRRKRGAVGSEVRHRSIPKLVRISIIMSGADFRQNKKGRNS
jgi:hypothetical protein